MKRYTSWSKITEPCTKLAFEELKFLYFFEKKTCIITWKFTISNQFAVYSIYYSYNYNLQFDE